MTADARRTEREDSRRRGLPRRAAPGAVLARTALAGAAALGALLLVLASWLTVVQIRVGSVERLENLETTFTGWDRHGPALLLLAIAAVPMLVGALRGARPAMAALAALGAVALLIAVTQDLPDLDETGRVGELYADASADAGAGFYAETLGGVLMLLGGGLLLLAARGERPARAGADEDRRSARTRDEQRPADGPEEG